MRVHSDQNGEEFRPQFDKLTKARDILLQNEERRKYFDNMFDILCKADVSFLGRGHTQWVETYEKKKKEEKKNERDNNEKQHLRLEGGLFFNTPRKPTLYLCNDKQRLVKVGLPIRDTYQFITYCHEAIVVVSCGTFDNASEIRLGSISKTNCSFADNDIIVKLYLPEYGIWDIKWYMIIESQGEDQIMLDTPHSECCTIDLRSKYQLDLDRRLYSLFETAK